MRVQGLGFRVQGAHVLPPTTIVPPSFSGILLQGALGLGLRGLRVEVLGLKEFRVEGLGFKFTMVRLIRSCSFLFQVLDVYWRSPESGY